MFTISKGNDIVIFEAFEAAATPAAILAAENALQWDFPGCALAIPYSEFRIPTFLEELTEFLEQANSESVGRFSTIAMPDNASIVDTRATAKPHLITQFLMGLLSAKGKPFATPSLRKRVRDDCSCRGSTVPWRRCPGWLVVRVAVQRQLCIDLGEALGTFAYKLMVAIVAASILWEYTETFPPQYLNVLRCKLCKRLSKIESLKSTILPLDQHEQCNMVFLSLQYFFQKTVETANRRIERMWDESKRSTVRVVPRLPMFAPPKAFSVVAEE